MTMIESETGGFSLRKQTQSDKNKSTLRSDLLSAPASDDEPE